MNVREAVLNVLIEHHPKVPNYLVHRAHPEHPLSVAQRLRELAKEGAVSYTFDRKTCTYLIRTSKRDLRRALL